MYRQQNDDDKPRRKRRIGKLVSVHKTGETYEDHRGREKEWWAYTPTDSPQNAYTSEDMALTVAGYEHGNIRTQGRDRSYSGAGHHPRDRS